MSKSVYPFLDIAVSEAVRGAFARGDALVILSPDLAEIVWANGPGAQLLGHATVEQAIGAESGLPVQAVRQIAGLQGFPRFAAPRPVMVRLTQGLRSATVALTASAARLPGGEDAVLLTAPAAGLTANAGSRAQAAISGLAGEGQHAALIGGDGAILAATDGFALLGIEQDTIIALVDEVTGEHDRLVKRLVTSGQGRIPAGFARLTDDPAVHLLLAMHDVDQDASADFASDETQGQQTVQDEEPLPGHWHDGSPELELPAEPDAQPETLAADGLPEPETRRTPRSVAELVRMAFGVSSRKNVASGLQDGDRIAASVTSSATAGEAASPGKNDNHADSPARHDDWYFDQKHDAVSHQDAALLPVNEPSDHSELTGEEEVSGPMAADSDQQIADEVPEAEESFVPAEPGEDKEIGDGLAVRAEAAEAGDTPAPLANPEADHAPSDPVQARTPVRFVWRTDADGVFTALSDEFIQAVGPNAADVIGRRFSDVAAVFDLDPDGEIDGLLKRRGTWSGRTVRWPLQGTDLKVPVDLAALPVYDRQRNFEGFRGFGVARLNDASADADKIGLALQPSVADEPADRAYTRQELPGLEAEDPFMGETPALEIAASPNRRTSDKIISLAEHRERPAERLLSPAERLAFREIGKTLNPADEPAAEVATTSDQPEAAVEAVPVAPPAPSINAWGLAPKIRSDDETASLQGAVGENKPDTGDEDYLASAFVEGVASEPRIRQEAASIEPGDPVEVPFLGNMLMPSDAGPVQGGLFQSGTRMPEVDEEAGWATLDLYPASSEVHHAEADRATEYGDGDQELLIWQDEASGPADFTGLPFGDGRSEDNFVPDAVAEETAQDLPVASAADDFASGEGEPPVDADQDAFPGFAPIGDTPEETVEASGMESANADEDAGAFAAEALSDDAPPSGLRLLAGDLSPSVLARLPMALIVARGETLAYANSAFLKLTGYDSLADLEEAGGLDQLIADSHDDDAGNRDDGLQDLRKADGDLLTVRTHMQSVGWHGGKALMLVFTPQHQAMAPSPAGRDVSRGTDETGSLARPANAFLDDGTPEELRATVNQLNTILDTATDGVVLIENDGSVRALNRSAQALFGFDNDAVAGKPFTHLFAVESQRAARDYLSGLSENGVASLLNDGREVIGREARGRFIPLFMTVGRLPADSGFCAVIRDITQWKRAEDELTEARRLAENASTQKTEFLARVSHEIRTPLNAIIGFSELMIGERFGPVGNERYKDYLRDINRSGNHVLDLVNDLLDISKIEAGQQELNYEAVALNDALTETVAIMQPQANRERVIIRSSFASGLPDVVADLRSIKQIALNLLSNAVKFTPPGGQVIVSTVYEPTGEVVVRVRDTGIGMSDADVEHALKPFKQLNTMQRTRGDGTGLGLPLTKAMVEANRAVFAINSRPGEGTMVQITFPAPRVLAD